MINQTRTLFLGFVIVSTLLVSTVVTAVFWTNGSRSRQPSQTLVVPSPKAGDTEELFLGSGVYLTLVFIPQGTFNMGSNRNSPDERPIHSVTVSNGFWMGKYPVTNAQWQAVMGELPFDLSHPNGCPDCPMSSVSWDKCQDFISRLNGRGKEAFRLPTEAEWEYACRAGVDGETYGPPETIAWYVGNSGKKTHPVGQKQPNAFGMYDMLGNVLQWCQDGYAPYSNNSQIDPEGDYSSAYRVLRGASDDASADQISAAHRHSFLPCDSVPWMGFRLVRALPKPKHLPKGFKDFWDSISRWSFFGRHHYPTCFLGTLSEDRYSFEYMLQSAPPYSTQGRPVA